MLFSLSYVFWSETQPIWKTGHWEEEAGRSIWNMDHFNSPKWPWLSILISSTAKTLHSKTGGGSTTKKRAAQKLGRSGLKQKPSQAAVTLADFFKVKAKADPLHSGGLLPSGKAASRTAGCSSSGPDGTTSRQKKAATSLILFEEVKQEHNETQFYTSYNIRGFHPDERLMMQRLQIDRKQPV